MPAQGLGIIMPEYVYALHDFLPEHEDEVSFRQGERIEVVEKDDMYSDGWWQVSYIPVEQEEQATLRRTCGRMHISQLLFSLWQYMRKWDYYLIYLFFSRAETWQGKLVCSRSLILLLPRLLLPFHL